MKATQEIKNMSKQYTRICNKFGCEPIKFNEAYDKMFENVDDETRKAVIEYNKYFKRISAKKPRINKYGMRNTFRRSN